MQLMNGMRQLSRVLWIAALGLGLSLTSCGGGDNGGGGNGGDSGGGGGSNDSSREVYKANPANEGSIQITVTYTGEAPEREKIDPSADAKCNENAPAEGILSEAWVVNDGKVANCFVHIVKGLEKWSFATPTTPVVLDQKGCSYIPHVFGIMKDQTLKIMNSDPTMHNVHPTPGKNPAWNASMPPGSESLEKTFKRAEDTPIPFKCDVHSWMNAKCHVTDHPFFAVTGATGVATITGVPAGEYTVEVWHEYRNKKKTITVKVEPGKTAEASVVING